MPQKKKGFTIIEVVLVLAIAGLIFLMVFIALPALQRSQRNAQRKNDLSRFMTAVEQYRANNHNQLPPFQVARYDTSTGNKMLISHSFVQRYIIAGGDTSQFQDPNGENYAFYLGDMCAAECNPCNKGTHCKTMALDYGFESNYDTHTESHDIYVISYAKCSADEGYVDYSSGRNDIAMIMILEGDSYACVDNQ